MENLNEFLMFIAILMGIGGYLNAERLRKRFNKLQKSLLNKGVVVEKDLWPNKDK